MIKLLKYLKPSLILIIICFLMVTIVGLSNLMLPDRMSVIISEGITTEILYEETEEGEPIYISMGTEKIPLPKFMYEGAGELVLTQDNEGDYLASIDMDLNNPPLYYTPETDINGDIIYFSVPDEDGNLTAIPMPTIIRTIDGNKDSMRQQGQVILDDAGAPQIEKRQVSNLDVIRDNGLIMVLITLISTLASVVVAYLSAKIGMVFGKDLRSKLFNKTIKFSSEEEDMFGSASLITRMTNDVNQLQMLIVMAHRMMLIVPIMFIGGLIMAFSKDAKMTGVLLISAPVVLIVILLVASKIIPLFKKMQKKIDALTLVSRENITGVRVIRAFGQDEKEENRFRNANTEVTQLAIKAARIMAVLFPLMQFIMSMTSIGVMIIATNRINAGLSLGTVDFTTLGNMMAVVQYMMQIMISIVMFSVIFIMVPRASVSAKRINEVFLTTNRIIDTDKPQKSNKINEVLEFNNVNFAFPYSSSNVLSDIDLKINRGETVAIIGSTGAGKTTLVNLIPRLYDVTNGEIRIDGVNIKNLTISDLRAKIGFTTQKSMLFEGTVSDNISYGSPNATREDIVKAAEIAQASEFINELDKGYDFWVEQGGANLSGGQKQRLAIARSICRRPFMYIFDDCFSALDFQTDKKLRKALKKITSDSAVIIVAQRIGTIMNADKIVVMQDGRIVGMGSHRELLKTCEVYKEIAISQMSEEELLRGDFEIGGAL